MMVVAMLAFGNRETQNPKIQARLPKTEIRPKNKNRRARSCVVRQATVAEALIFLRPGNLTSTVVLFHGNPLMSVAVFQKRCAAFCVSSYTV